ncbi:flagellar basal body P-ring formation protein FlgA [bacterium]|nr:flagellar basal body P-ring formation protein FlgA [bacterium]
MRKIISTALIILSVMANSAFALTLTDTFVRDEIRKQVIEQNKKYTDAELKVIIANMPFSTMTIADGQLKFVVSSNFDKFVPRDIKKVYIYSNGHLEKEFIVSVRTLAYKNVLCARTMLDREALLSKANVVPKRMEVSANLDYVLTEDMLNNRQMITKKWFREGEILDKRFVRIKPDVERNAQVQLYIKSNGVLVSITGTAMDEGMVGDYINITNKSYNKKYKGRVIGENKVLVNI